MKHILALVLLLTACRLPPPDSKAGKVIRCGTDAVLNNFGKALPSVNTCISSAPDYEGCLFGLIDPVVGITEDVIACVLRDQGAKFAAQAEANPGDSVSARAAVRAQAFINHHQYVFADPADGR